mgnify:CR=1 FL=1
MQNILIYAGEKVNINSCNNYETARRSSIKSIICKVTYICCLIKHSMETIQLFLNNKNILLLVEQRCCSKAKYFDNQEIENPTSED